jgi:NAD+ kinase
MKHFFIVARDEKAENLTLIHNIMDYIRHKGGTCDYGINPDDAAEAELLVPPTTDVILTIGGDGTLIRAAQNTFGRNIPLIGINRGHLGYLCNLDEGTVFEGIDSMMQGDVSIEERMMLTGYVMHPDGSITQEVQALNDIVVRTGALFQVMRVRVYVNGKYLYAYNCDGMIFSTPTGSTAYNLSAHGPIVDPKTNLILLTPINPHTLNARSIVLDPYDELALEICSRRDDVSQEAELSFDGNHKRLIQQGDKLMIRRAKETTRMIRLSDISFLDRIRLKLQAE